jgi:type I restriction enzyme S subunit
LNYRIVIPTDAVLGDFVSLVTPMNEKRLLLASESGCLACLRDTLLPRLMFGEISVADLGDVK